MATYVYRNRIVKLFLRIRRGLFWFPENNIGERLIALSFVLIMPLILLISRIPHIPNSVYDQKSDVLAIDYRLGCELESGYAMTCSSGLRLKHTTGYTEVLVPVAGCSSESFQGDEITAADGNVFALLSSGIFRVDGSKVYALESTAERVLALVDCDDAVAYIVQCADGHTEARYTESLDTSLLLGLGEVSPIRMGMHGNELWVLAVSFDSMEPESCFYIYNKGETKPKCAVRMPDTVAWGGEYTDSGLLLLDDDLAALYSKSGELLSTCKLTAQAQYDMFNCGGKTVLLFDGLIGSDCRMLVLDGESLSLGNIAESMPLKYLGSYSFGIGSLCIERHVFSNGGHLYWYNGNMELKGSLLVENGVREAVCLSSDGRLVTFIEADGSLVTRELR